MSGWESVLVWLSGFPGLVVIMGGGCVAMWFALSAVDPKPPRK